MRKVEAMFRRFRDDEDGMAMVVSLLVAFVVLLLSVYVVQLGVHNVSQSGYDRSRLISVTAAESGVDDYYAYLNNFTTKGTPDLTSVQCSITNNDLSGPNASSYTASVTFYNAAGSTVGCGGGPPPSLGTVPASVRITSIGNTSGQASRKMESYATLASIIGGTSSAVFSNGSTTLNNKLDVNGYQGSDGDVYVNGSLTVSQSMTFSGSVYVQGSATISNSTTVDGTLWAKNAITMTGQSLVTGDAISSQGNISISTPAHIYGNAKAKGTIASTSLIQGTSSPSTNGLADPPTQTFPLETFDSTQQSAWTNSGYTIVSKSTCTGANSAQAFINGLSSNPGPYKYVVQITAACSLPFSSSSLTLHGDLAIITDGSICTTQQNTFQAAGGVRNLMFIVRSGAGSTSNCGSPDFASISISNLTNFNDLSGPNQLNTFLYSPYKIALYNNSGFTGQAYGSPVSAQNQVTLNYVPVFVPGISTITGFRQNVQYIREVPAP
jgi:cytoskeletal protein CcmA (bactofilin family)/Tfp pilus assembly protein PilX